MFARGVFQAQGHFACSPDELARALQERPEVSDGEAEAGED